MTANLPVFLDNKQIRRRERLAWAGRIGIFSGSFLLTVVIFMWGTEPAIRQREFVVGEPSPRTFFSPFHLTYVNEKDTSFLRQQKSLQVPPVFSFQPQAVKETRNAVENFFSFLHQAKEKNIKAEKAKPPFQVSEATLKLLFEGSKPEEVRKHLEMLIEEHLNQGVLEDSRKRELLEAGVAEILALDSGAKTEKILPLKGCPTTQTALDSSAELLKELIPKDNRLRDSTFEIFAAVMRPNLFLDGAETKARREKAAESVEPVQEEIKKDELIVQRGMLITEPEKKRLDLIEKQMAKKKALHKLLAVSLLIFMTFLMGFLYLWFFEKKTLQSFRLIILIHTVFLLTNFLSKTACLWPESSLYLMPSALAPLLLTLLISPRAGIFGSAFMAVMAAPLAAFSPDIIVGTLLASAAGVFAALRVRKRMHFLIVGMAIGISYFFVIFAFQIFQEYSLSESFLVSVQGWFNGFLITAPLAFLLLPLFESVFNLTTDITLLELSDLNHPLLKRMIIEAPGTYHHSLVVSTLAESACEAIGANALLARVGCYFHDIGKIAKAPYFTENQGVQGRNKHEKLTPTMSCLLIMNHVKDGMELGRQYKLKQRILQFIPEHQGTGVIYYFYKKALDQAPPGQKIRVEDFRYPGPKPQSKETAVALLSDSTEAASRSLRDPTPASIRQLVRKIINDKFIDGQLDECNLTLRDLHKIQDSFVHNLTAIFHTRVSYPAMPDIPDKPDLFEEAQFSKFRANS